jgi:hypothetical protein
MKIQFAILLVILVVTGTLGQDRTLSADSDTVFWYKYYAGIKNQIGLEPIDKVQDDFYFRLWTGVNVIELRREEGKVCGDVIFLVQQYKKNRVGRIYFKKTPLTTETSERVYALVNNYKIIELPTDKQINGWEMGLDGITYFIETAEKTNFSCKTYWTPTHYEDKLVEAKRLVDFLDEINRIEELNSIGKRFMERQPFSTWYNFIGSATIVSKIR